MIKQKRFLSLIVAFMVLVTTAITGTVSVSAGSEKNGGLYWYYRDSSATSIQGISSVTEHDGYLYAAFGSKLYKIKASTGALVKTATLSGSVGYNKIAPTVADTKAGTKILVPLGSAKLDIVNASDMKIDKSITYAEGQTSHQSLTPAVYSESDNSVYLGSWRKNMGGTYAKVSLDDYQVTAIQDSETGFYWSGASASGDYVVFGSGACSDNPDDPNTPSNGDATLYAYSKETGTILSEVLQDSGSICSTVVEVDGTYYFTSKAGFFYEATVEDGALCVTKLSVGAKSTCTPCVDGTIAYIGAMKKVIAVDITRMLIIKEYQAPGDVKGLAINDSTVYATYNSSPGGIYNVTEEKAYFVPESNMQNYCISSIAVGADGTMYYTNDSNYIMAVKNKSDIQAPAVASQKTVSATLTSSNAFKITWSNQSVAWTPGVSAKATVKYKVEMRKYGKSWSTIKSAATGTSLTKTGLTKGVRYSFRVTPYVTVNGTTYYGTAKTTAYQYTLAAPSSKPTVKKASSKKVKVSWKAVKNADGYQIYKSNYKSKNFKKAATVKAKYTYAKVSAVKKKTVYYKVRAYKKVGSKTIYGPWSKVSSGYKLK